MTIAGEKGRCEVEVGELALTIRLHNPAAANALTPAMLTQIRAGLDKHGAARVVFLTGSNGMFSSGYDTSELAQDPSGGKALLAEVLDLIELHPVPVIAVVEGHCVGAGLELALACDFRIASSTARFLMPPAKLGIVYPAAGVRRLVDVIGAARTRYMMYTAEQMDAQSALRIGLVERVVPEEEIDLRVDELRRTLVSERAPQSIRGLKETVRVVAEELSAGAIRQRARLDRLAEEALGSEDHAEAMRARAERRPPRFTGA